jgi:hypothetical protein
LLYFVDDDSKSVMDKFHYLTSQHLVKENVLECKSEVHRYLWDGCEAVTKNFNVLAWWKINAHKYHILTTIDHNV